MFIDTHCHLDAQEFDHDRTEVVARALAAGVDTMVIPAVTAAGFEASLSMRTQFGQPVALGLHPVFVSSHRDEDLALLKQVVKQEQPIAIGEIGLDFFVEGLDHERQIALFAAQLKLARDFELPVLLHIRHAQDQVLKQLRRFGIRQGIAHAFNGSMQQAKGYIDQGLKLGFGGTLTFERALNIRHLARELPIEAIVLETDAPDISPAWAYRQRNEPSYLPRIAAELAVLRGMTIADLARVTSENARTVLGLD